MKEYIKEVKLLKMLRDDKIPHAVIISEPSNKKWMEYVSEGVPRASKDVAVIIPSKFTGYSEYDFTYAYSLHDSTAERDLKYITESDLSEYEVKFKNDEAKFWQYKELDFKYYCDLVSIYDFVKLNANVKLDFKYYKHLVDTGKIPSVEISGKQYVDPSIMDDYVFEVSRLKAQTEGYELFNNEE